VSKRISSNAGIVKTLKNVNLWVPDILTFWECGYTSILAAAYDEGVFGSASE
jgi:hypothetical protein